MLSHTLQNSMLKTHENQITDHIKQKLKKK